MIDPITETDLEAYVDGQLDAMRRLDVEVHLAEHPDDAARVMADLRDRDALREAYMQVTGPEPLRLHAAARRLDRSIAWRNVGARLRRAAAIVLLVGAGWLAHTEIGTFGVPGTVAATVDPALIEDARQAHQAVQLRAKTATQRATPSYDQADLEAATGLELPDMPGEWSVRDVQIFPSRRGPGVEVAIDAGQLGDLALFATHSNKAGGEGNGTLSRSQDGTTAYWQAGRTTYALSSSREGIDLDAAAIRLAARH